MHGIENKHGVVTPKAASEPQSVKTFSTGTIGTDEYWALAGCKPGQSLEDDFGPVSAVPQERRKKVIIVGAGINGIQQATVLLDDGYVDLNDIQMFDALDGYGGVWQKNKYPGCACDVPAMIYTTSYNINRSETMSISSPVQHQLTNNPRLDAFLC